MNPFDTLSTDVYYHLLSFLPEKEISDQQSVSKKFYSLASADIVWKKFLDNMCVKSKKNTVKEQVIKRYGYYIKYLKNFLNLPTPLQSIFELKKTIDHRLIIEAEEGKLYFPLRAFFDQILINKTMNNNKKELLLHLIFPLVQPEWKNYTLNIAAEKSFLFIPFLINLGASLTSNSLTQAIRKCHDQVPKMLTTGFQPKKEHLETALVQAPELVPLLLEKGAKPDLESLKLAKKYCPQHIESIKNVL